MTHRFLWPRSPPCPMGPRGKKRLEEPTETWKNNSSARARKIIPSRSRSLYPSWFVGKRDPKAEGGAKRPKKDGTRLDPATGRTPRAGGPRGRGRSAPSLQREKELNFPGIQQAADGPSRKVIEESLGTLGKTGKEAYAYLRGVYETSEAFKRVLRDAGVAPKTQNVCLPGVNGSSLRHDTFICFVYLYTVDNGSIPRIDFLPLLRVVPF